MTNRALALAAALVACSGSSPPTPVTVTPQTIRDAIRNARTAVQVAKAAEDALRVACRLYQTAPDIPRDPEADAACAELLREPVDAGAEAAQ